MKKSTRFITLGLGLALGATLLSGCALKGSSMAHADPEPAVSVEFILNQSWGSDFGLYAWDSNGTPILGAWSDDNLGKMTLQDGLYHQTVESSTDVAGIILRFKEDTTYWQSVDMTPDGGFQDGHKYLLSDSAWLEDIAGGKKCTTAYEDYDTQHTYHIAGSPNGWEGYVATFDNEGKATVTLAEGADFKFVVDDWKTSFSVEAISNPTDYFQLSDEQWRNVRVLQTGEYTFTLPDHFFAKRTGVTFTYKEVEIEHSFGLVGSRNGWADTDFAKFTDGSLEIYMTKGEDFQIRADLNWGHLDTFEALANPGAEFTKNTYNNIEVMVTGTYTFTLPNDFFTTRTGVTYTFVSDVPASDGYYLVGSKTSFKLAGSVKMESREGYIEPQNSAELIGYEAEANEKIKVRGYFSDNYKPDAWSYYGGEAIEGVGAADGDLNFVFSAAKKVNIYAKWVEIQEDKWELKFYVAEYNSGANEFYTKFLTEVGGTCDANGNTNTATLQGVWADQKAAFEALSAGEKAVIRAVEVDKIEGDGANDLEKFVKKYDYIVKKYGTTLFEDFVWGQSYPGQALVSNTPATANETTPIMIIVIACVALLSVASVTTIIIIKKRRFVR